MKSRRKGRLQEVLSKALYGDDPKAYYVAYRDFDLAKELPLLEFLKASDNFETIPISRVIKVRRLDEVVYKTSNQSLLKLLEAKKE